MVCIGNIFQLAGNYFGVIFQQEIMIWETYLLPIKRFWKTADKLVDLSTID
jgi:hypothetical protein